jgi:hypothetical protein
MLCVKALSRFLAGLGRLIYVRRHRTMKELRSYGDDPVLGRHLFSLGVSALRDLSGPLGVASQHFIALVACDAALASVDEMSEASACRRTHGFSGRGSCPDLVDNLA